jgi:hypothetical protein
MLIWVKRLAPFVIIAVAIYIYVGYARKEEEKRAAIDDRHALVTAQIWVASAKYRANPEEYQRVRDSLLTAAAMTKDDLIDFVNADTSQPENLAPFLNLVQMYIDSLLDIEDSLAMEREDSLRQVADTTR